MIDVVEPPLIPFLYAERVLRMRQRVGAGRYSMTVKGPRISSQDWTEVAARAEREGLRAVARDLGVSHETVRAVVKRVEQSRGTARAHHTRVTLPPDHMA
jgi:hypothetical protein